MTLRQFFDIVRRMPDISPRITQIAREIRAVIKNAFADPEALAPTIPALLALHRVVAEAGLDASDLDRVSALRTVVLPDYLARIGTGREAKALREMFVLDPGEFRAPTLSDLYYHAIDHLPDVSLDAFERRRLPKLITRFAGLILEFDAADRRAERTTASQHCQRLWGYSGRAKVTLVFPELPPPERPMFAQETVSDHVGLLKFADLDTLFELKTFLSRQFPLVDATEFVWTEVPSAALRENVIIVGGVAWNGLTADYLARVGSPIQQRSASAGQPDVLIDATTDEDFGPTFTATRMVSRDYGLFVRAPNPLALGRSVTIIDGVLTHGVLGAAKCFGSTESGPANCSALFNELGGDSEAHFAALIAVDVVANYVPVPDLGRQPLVRLHRL